jgi:uncharacterized membrane protein (DUF485 family)
MEFWTTDRIATLSTYVLLDNLVDFSKQLAKTKTASRQLRIASIIGLIKMELSDRAA